MKTSSLLGIAIMSLFLFVGIVYGLFFANFSGIWDCDLLINSAMPLLHSSAWGTFLTPFFIGLSTIFDPLVFLLWFSLLCIVLWRNGYRFEVFFVVWGVVFGQVIKLLVKYLTARDRPENPFELSAHESSFPSGHSTTAVFFLCTILYLFTGNLEKKYQFLARSVLILGVFLIPFSRVYEQIHYASDIVAGALLGVFSFVSTMLFFRVLKTFAPEFYKKYV